MLDPTGAHAVEVNEARISTDETALQIVLRNLMDNVFRHSGDSTKRLEVSVVDGGEGKLVFSVRDFGIGFKSDTADLLEEGKMRKGAGFGLLGVRRLINARGGTITARSPEGGPGALVKFTLPGKIISMDSN